MSEKETKKELVTVVLDQPYITNGVKLEGTVEVSPEVAADLQERMKRFADYERSMIRDNGKQLDAGTVVGNGQ